MEPVVVTRREECYVVLPRSAPLAAAADMPELQRSPDRDAALAAIASQKGRWRVVKLITTHTVCQVEEW